MKHNRRSIRLQGYNYAQSGLYFITLCTQNRAHLFGQIINGEMILNDAGMVAAKCWQDITVHFPKTKLHEYVIMPDHIHGIIESIKIVGAQDFEPRLENKFQQIIPQSIGSIIRGFKIGVTKWFRYENQGDQNMRVWQRNYYEHIIRSDAEYHRIANYIVNNPAKWSRDSKS